MIILRIKSFFNWLILQEQSSRKLALSMCMGIYIAFSPFIGFHTVMAIVLSRLLVLNFAALFAISVLINNPWTMIPVYSMGHFFGLWLFDVLNIDAMYWDPSWLEACNNTLQKYIGISGLSLSAFFVGGNILGILVAVVAYPVVKYILIHCMTKKS